MFCASSSGEVQKVEFGKYLGPLGSRLILRRGRKVVESSWPLWGFAVDYRSKGGRKICRVGDPDTGYWWSCWPWGLVP